MWHIAGGSRRRFIVWGNLSHPWQVCVEQAWKGYCAGSFPIGAAVVGPDGRVLTTGSGHLLDNGQIHLYNDAGGDTPLSEHKLAHAELQALLSLDYDGLDPSTCSLYTTLEPCPLCLGAICMADVRELHYGCRDPWAGSAHLVEHDRYLSSQIHRVVGPLEKGLETALAVLTLEPLIRTRGSHVLDWHDGNWRMLLADSIAPAKSLAESGRLWGMGEQGAPASAMFDELSVLVAGSSAG
jgi:tRNA(Arg) A34 adenosine deaminase TadA